MALYHTYRPQTFADVVGQEHIVKTITNQIASGRVAHAYLFTGARGLGKTTTARLIAKALNCANRKAGAFEPCDSCDSCQEIRGSRAIDVIEIDAASQTGVDNVRENIIESARFQPTKSPYKVFIIDEAHMLSMSAFNALLKTLEEPPEHVVLILATTEPHKLPDTIISRCQRFDFKKVAYDTMKQHLEMIAKAEKIKVNSDVADRIINKSDGCVRDAVSLLDQIMATGEKHITADAASLVLPTARVDETLRFVRSLILKNAADGLGLLNALAGEGTHFVHFADDAIELLRLMMIGKATGGKAPVADLSQDAQNELNGLGKSIENADLVRLIDLVMKRRQEIQSSPLPQLPLEMAVVEWTAMMNQESGIKNQANEAKDNGQASNGAMKQLNSSAPQSTISNRQSAITNQPPNAESESRSSSEEADTAKKTIAQRVKDLVSKDPVCTVEEVQACWNAFLKKLESESPSLVFVLKMGEIIGVEGHAVRLAVPYSFHRDKLMEKKCAKQLESLLTEALGKKARIDAVLREKSQAPEETKDLEELATALGGEVVQ